MPVEIRELVIRAVATSDTDTASGKEQHTTNPESQEEVIQECVRQVLKILKKEKER